VPKAISLDDDDDRPRRRRRAAAVTVDEPAERGLVMRILLHSPKDMVAGLIAFAAVSAIIANAVFMQAGRHPSPMFGSSVVTLPAPPAPPASLLPRPRPIDAAAKSIGPVDVKPLESRPSESKPADPLPHLAKPAAAPANVTRPPASIPPSRVDPLGDLITSSRRVASVQRALTEYGYGQLKPTGTVGSDTQAAIQKFERDRKLPVTGQMSDRLMRELAAMTGKPIE